MYMSWSVAGYKQNCLHAVVVEGLLQHRDLVEKRMQMQRVCL